jgi:hypothetical protein
MNPICTITVPVEPLCATTAWTQAVADAEGQCTCTGRCGRSHKNMPEHRCDQTLTGGNRLYLTGDGALMCARCFDGAGRASRKDARADAGAYQPESLLDLLATDRG